MEFSYRRAGKPVVVKFVVGRKYLVAPLNPQNRRCLGRVCICLGNDLRDCTMWGNSRSVRVKVRYCDNNRVGYQDGCDLIPFVDNLPR